MDSSASRDPYALFSDASSRLFTLCEQVVNSETSFTSVMLSRMHAFLRLFRTKLTPEEKGAVFGVFFDQQYPAVQTDTTLVWLRGNPIEASDGNPRSRCFLAIGQAYIDLGLVYTVAANRANRANDLMQELGSSTPELMEQASAPLVIAYCIYSCFVAVKGQEGQNAVLAERLTWLGEQLGDDGAVTQLDALFEKAQRFMTPAVGIIDNILQKTVEGNANVHPSFAQASAAFREKLRQNPEQDAISRFGNAIQGTFVSDSGRNMMDQLEQMMGSDNPGLQRFVRLFGNVRSGQDVVDVVSRATEDPAIIADVERGVTTAVSSLMAQNASSPPDSYQAAANQAAMESQQGMDYPIMT